MGNDKNPLLCWNTTSIYIYTCDSCNTVMTLSLRLSFVLSLWSQQKTNPKCEVIHCISLICTIVNYKMAKWQAIV